MSCLYINHLPVVHLFVQVAADIAQHKHPSSNDHNENDGYNHLNIILYVAKEQMSHLVLSQHTQGNMYYFHVSDEHSSNVHSHRA